MSEDVKSSAHIWGEGRSPNNATDEPPAYVAEQAGPSNDNSTTHVANAIQNPPTVTRRRTVQRTTYDPIRRLNDLSTIPWQKYNMPDGTLSPDGISLTVKHSDLYSHAQHLLPFILEQALLPPKPMLHIVGSSYGGFNIVINLTHLLNLRNHRWGFSSAQVSPIQNEPRTLCERSNPAVMTLLATTVKQFCKDRSENKSYTLTRKIDGLPTDVLAGYVRNLAASIKYVGRLKIEFIDERSRIVVHKQPSSWFSSLLNLHPEKKFEMVETVWDLTDPLNENSDVGSSEAGLRTVQEWWQCWSDTIRNAIIAKRRGTLGIDDWIETRMGRYEQEPRLEWGRDHEV